MNNERHPCRYIDCTLEHDGSWVDGKWYEWEDIYGNREVARNETRRHGPLLS